MNKKNLLNYVMVGALCVSLTAGGCLTYASASNTKETLKEDVNKVVSKLNEEKPEAATYRDETVFVITNENGAVEKMILNDTLKDNVNKTEDFSQSVISADAPVDIDIAYTMDGVAMSAKEVLGKSGHLTITYSYTNNETCKAMIGGKEKTVYVPFAVVTGMLLDTDTFSNVTVKGGRVIGDGTRQAVLGIAFPGLTESLTNKDKNDVLNSDSLKLPESLTVEADVTDFSISNAYTLVTNFQLSESDDSSSLTGKLTDLTGKLSDAMEQLLDGSEKLHEGLVSASDGCSQLTDGAASAYEGSGKLSDGAVSASEGSKQISAGLNELTEGLNTLDANSAALSSGAKQVFDTLLATANDSLKAAGVSAPALTVDNYSAVLQGVIKEVKATDAEAVARAKVTEQVNANRAQIEAGVTEAVSAQILAQVVAKLDMTVDSYQAALGAGMIPADKQAVVNTAVSAQLETPEIKALIASKTDEQVGVLVEQYMGSKEVKAQIKEGKATIKESTAKLNSLKDSLDSYNTFYQGIIAYTAGVGSAANGAAQLSNGAASLSEGLGTLSEGAASLNEGLGTLSNGLTSLNEGLVELRDGSLALADGIAQLNDELVSVLLDFVDNDAATLSDSLRAIAKASEEYKSVNGLNGAEDGAVKYIYKLGKPSQN